MNNRRLINALSVISAQVNHCERLLNCLIAHHDVQLPPELIEAGHRLTEKNKILRDALDAQLPLPPEQQK